MTSVPVYVTPDGRSVPIPPELAAKTKFTKTGVPDRRLKANAEFAAWADAADKQVPAEVALIQAEMRAGVELAALGSTDINPAQAYALRVWNGQSPDVPRNERIRRVEKALGGQGLSMEGVELP